MCLIFDGKTHGRKLFNGENFPNYGSRTLSLGENFREFSSFGAILESYKRENFIEYGGVIINGRVIVVSRNSWKF